MREGRERERERQRERERARAREREREREREYINAHFLKSAPEYKDYGKSPWAHGESKDF